MSVFARLRDEVSGIWNRVTGPTRTTGRRSWVSGRSGSGVFVDADTALKNATVWACIQYLSRSVAQLAWRVMRETPSGGSMVQTSHPADWVLHKRPNPEMGSFTFRQTMMGWVLRKGNAYAEIERDMRGAVAHIWPIHPDRVEVKRDGAGLFYRVWNDIGSAYVDMDPMDILHIRGFGDGVVGLDVISYAAESIGWAQATELFGATFFGEGMNPTGVVTVEKALTKPAFDILREELERIYKGPRGKRTAILDAGMTWNRASTPQNEAQFIETRQHQVEEICRWFGVPPHKVMHLLRATFSNIEHQSIEVVVDSITPWVKTWEEEADYKIFGRDNRLGFFTKMNLKSLMRGDAKSRAEYYVKLWGVGGLTINQILIAEDMNPIGPDGDVRFVPANMMTLERAIKGQLALPPPVGADERPAAEDAEAADEDQGADA